MAAPGPLGRPTERQVQMSAGRRGGALRGQEGPAGAPEGEHGTTIPSSNALPVYPRELNTCVRTKMYLQTLIAAIFIIAKKWRQLKCPSTEAQRQKPDTGDHAVCGSRCGDRHTRRAGQRGLVPGGWSPGEVAGEWLQMRTGSPLTVMQMPENVLW